MQNYTLYHTTYPIHIPASAPPPAPARFEFVRDVIPVADVANLCGLADDSVFDDAEPLTVADLEHEAAPFTVAVFGDIRALGFDKPAAELTADERALVPERYEQARRPKTWQREHEAHQRREQLRREREARLAATPAPAPPDFSPRADLCLPVSDEARAAISAAPVVLSKWAANKAKAATKKTTAAPRLAPVVAPSQSDIEPARRDAVNRVSAYVSELQARHAGRADKLAKSLAWQVSEIENVIKFHAAKGRDAVAALEIWERGAVAAANAKVVA